MSIDREHLDAETVAAWIDGGLDARAAAAAEAHASNCDRCQALLATVTATLPAEVIDAPAHSKLWKWWFAPLAASAAAVTLWMVVPQDPMQQPPSPQRQSEIASAPASPPPPTPAPAPPAEATAAKPSAPAPADARAESRARTQRKDGGRNEASADTASREEKQEPVAALQERVTITAESPMVGAPPAPAPEGAALGATAQAALVKRAGPLEIIAPDPQIRWRVTGGAIERSQNGGRAWSSARLNPEEIITAGVAPSAAVCWMVGRQGLVLLAADGINFTRLPFPERVDLASITATGAVRATVVTADGRTFETADGGRNWRNP